MCSPKWFPLILPFFSELVLAVCLPRRLARFSELRSPSTGSLTTSSVDRAGPQLSGKLGEIRAVSHPYPGVLGHGFGISESIGLSQSRQDSDHYQGDPVPAACPQGPGQTVASVARLLGQPCGRLSRLSSSHETFS